MEFREQIKGVALKATPQRRLVYETMQVLCHAPMDEIIARVQSLSPDITLSTIYRILELFCETGLLSRINHPDGKCYFDISTKNHHHIITSNNDIIDFEDSEINELIQKKLKKKVGKGEKIKKISIQIILENAKK